MPLLIAALSGRVLAAAARRAGADVVVADVFGDVDTRSLGPWLRLPGNLADGIDRDAVEILAHEVSRRIDGIVYGAGFETTPGLLAEFAKLAPLIGNPPETVAAVKDPYHFAETLRRLGLSHPSVAPLPGTDGAWLRKRRGGSGGTHIRPAELGATTTDPDYYYQAVAPGSPLSALFVANGRAARVIGRSAQWSDATATQPFRYGGCAGPISVTRRRAKWIENACDAVAEAFGLVGLNSLDMLVDGDAITILEINPRPGATLDIFDDGPAWLWDLHCRSLRGELPPALGTDARPLRAATILYADRARRVPGELVWEPWIADISPAGTLFSAGDPICTILSTGPDLARARDQGRRRGDEVLCRLPELLPETA